MSTKKLERVLQLLINEETDKANEILHNIFVEKSRNIYLDMIKEDEDLEKAMTEAEDDEYDFDVSDMENDLEDDDISDDVEDYDDMIDSEEMYEAEDDEDEMDMDDAEMDLSDEMSDEMDMDADMDMDMDMDSDEASDPESSVMDIENALEELKSYFAELVGDSEEDEMEDDFAAGDEMDSEYEYDEDEMDGEMSMDDEMDDEKIKESVQLTKVASPTNKAGDDSKSSPVAKGKGVTLGKPMKDAIVNKEETGGTATKPKELGVPGPQAHGAKLKPATTRKMKG
jgi:hypothetical protein